MVKLTKDHFEANLNILNLRLQEFQALNSKCVNTRTQHDIQRLRALGHRITQLLQYDMQFRSDDGMDSDPEDIVTFHPDGKRRQPGPATVISKKPKLKETPKAEKANRKKNSAKEEPMSIESIIEVKESKPEETAKIPEALKETQLRESRPPSRRMRNNSNRTTTPPEVEFKENTNLIKIGDLVVVLIKGNWILGYVTKIEENPNPNKTAYTIQDYEEPDEITEKHRRHIMRLPPEAKDVKSLDGVRQLKKPMSWPEYKQGATVFALYPDTTSVF
eukprot:NODE_713_length_4517_cov_0.967180.p2 type:complete len:275 gc:universal NODE_713_length_4517_cov_0.967180:2204-1380(-)